MRGVLGVVVALSLLVLTGCEADPVYSPPPEPTTPPIFESEDEAMDVVRQMMDDYVAALTVGFVSDGRDTAALEAISSDTQFIDDLASLPTLHEKSWTFVGQFDYFGLSLQQLDQHESGVAYVQAYVCLDYRLSEFHRPDGSVFEGEVPWAPFEVLVSVDPEKTVTLDELRYWTGRDFCESLVSQ